MNIKLSLGALYEGNGTCGFRVWAPNARKAELHLISPEERWLSLEKEDDGYYFLEAQGIEPGSAYKYRLDGKAEYPDPASRYQPEGVHGASVVIDRAFAWTDSCWFGIPLKDYIFYELHVGTFSPKGTFEGVIERLDHLVELGVTAVEVMPVAQFPGGRNWGYDGTYPFAAQSTYGGPRGLMELANACHGKGLAVVLDVVYNHFGPEGSYVRNFGPYFTDRHRTPWGEAINFDGALSEGVRRFFTESALSWLRDFHFDALRIDAVHAIVDFSATPFLHELGLVAQELSEKLNRQIHLIPESDLNDVRLIRERNMGGFGLDAQWLDDFHHSLVALLTKERTGYYEDFGRLGHLAKSFREGYVYTGQYSRYRQRRHGNSSAETPGKRFVVFSQNHDQIGNRMRGERLSEVVSFEALKITAAAVITAPFLPLLFMGEEYGETARFPYFISHGDPALVEAVRKGRHEEFLEFEWEGEPPDPQGEETFQSAKLNHHLKENGQHKGLLEFYKELIRLRKQVPALAHLEKQAFEVHEFEPEQILLVHRWEAENEVVLLFHFKESTDRITMSLPPGKWKKIMDSGEKRWSGPGGFLPESLDADGAATIEVPAFAAAAYEKQAVNKT